MLKRLLLQKRQKEHVQNMLVAYEKFLNITKVQMYSLASVR